MFIFIFDKFVFGVYYLNLCIYGFVQFFDCMEIIFYEMFKVNFLKEIRYYFWNLISLKVFLFKLVLMIYIGLNVYFNIVKF